MNVVRMAIIENGVVVNAALVDIDSDWQPPQGQIAVAHERASKGWLYDGVNFANVNEDEIR